MTEQSLNTGASSDVLAQRFKGVETLSDVASFSEITLDNSWGVDNPIENLSFRRDLIIDNRSNVTKKISFNNCEFRKITIKNISEVDSISFADCTIEKLQIYKSSFSLNLSNCEVHTLVSEACNDFKIKAESSDIVEVSLESGGTVSEIRLSNGCSVSSIYDRDANVGKIRIHTSKVGFININSHLEELQLLEGSDIERFSINKKDELISFLNKIKKKSGTISEKERIIRANKDILIAAFSQYEEEHKYKEMDLCLLKLRKINNYNDILKTKNPVKKFWYMCQEFVIGKMFGWGIAIHNSIATSAVIILAFAVQYFYFMRGQFDSVVSCAVWCFFESLNRFFGVGADSRAVLPFFDSAEGIVGVIIMTIFTGVLARKIIR